MGSLVLTYAFYIVSLNKNLSYSSGASFIQFFKKPSILPLKLGF